MKVLYICLVLLISMMPNIFDARSFAAEKINGSMQCDFLSQDYFNRSNAEKNAVDCLKQGYTLGVQDTETGNTPLHLLAPAFPRDFKLFS